MSTRRGSSTQTSENVPFDPQGTTLTETQIGPALRELANTVGVSASPGFSFGKSGNLSSGTFLDVTGSVPSNRAGITVALNNPEITQIFVANQDINTFTVSIYEHEGDEINLTLIGSVNIVSARSASFDVSFFVTSGKQLAARITAGSAKNLTVGLQLKGNV